MLLSWMFFNIVAIVGCDALPVGLNGGSVELPSKSLIILVVVGTLLAILSFMAVIAYWNATLFVACRSRPTDAISAGAAGRPARSVETNRRRGGPWPSGNSKVSAATASPSSMGRPASNTRSTLSTPIRPPKPALKIKLAAPVVGSR